MLGRRVLEAVDPDEHLARQLEAEEAAAARTTTLTLTVDGHGSIHGRFKVPTLVGEMLRTALHALANPSRPDPIPRQGRARHMSLPTNIGSPLPGASAWSASHAPSGSVQS